MAQNSYSRVFVTVGTTRFDALIEAINSTEVANILVQQLHCTALTVQHGAGADQNLRHSPHYRNVAIDTYAFRSSIAADISAADLVISHAGAGSCIEVLTAAKPLIVVVNDALMGNHQAELAEQLAADGHILHCAANGLADVLRMLVRRGDGCGGEELFRPYVAGSVDRFVKELDAFMGFA